MAVAFTINSTVSVGEWTVVDGCSTDVSTAQALVAAAAGHSHLLKSITITMQDADGRYFQVLNDAVLFIGPVRPYSRQWHRRYESALEFSGAINILTETDRNIHVTAEYRTIPTTVI